jgi:dTDP-4-amino-4,6-dideoxygalactose transaminase
LLINDSTHIERAHVISEKGTNRKKFIDCKVDKYSWVDYGSSHIASEITAAVLKAQLEEARDITNTRKSNHEAYLSGFAENQELLNSAGVRFLELESSNGHMFPLIFATSSDRDVFIERMAQAEIQVVSHYVPLHSSKFGVAIGRTDSEMSITDHVAAGLVRLPMWSEEGLPVKKIISAALESIRSISQQKAQ